ncbi:PDZ domain-containing protein [Leucobacter weissii]|uniref:PDZ domain-containing protein n=1 Tax=Leucobacter weissii TaxID=1983706 RepID=A0A939S9P9_9MICO|nr:S16 family serine protease [Leucobacter weissii]MBO1901152.1 PDZ domain-containing protein [Leucobacter weissii]
MAKRGAWRWWLAAAMAATAILLASTTPSPYAIQAPGPVVDVFGTIETEDGTFDVLQVDGTETYETAGSLNVLSVVISGSPEHPASWLRVLGAMTDPTKQILPREAVFPDEVSSDERTQQNAELMLSSQATATAAALNKLGTPPQSTVVVAGVFEDGPAVGTLREGDLLLGVDGKAVSTVAELRAEVGDREAGDAALLEVEREGRRLEISLVPESLDGSGELMLGVTAAPELDVPFDVELELDRIGGPSAGLVFALAVYDLLTPGELTGGLAISGTGTMDVDGTVGPIGGLSSKLWAAASAGTDLMLMPVENCADLPERLPAGMKIVPVADLDEAVEAIGSVAAGGSAAGVERCRAG